MSAANRQGFEKIECSGRWHFLEGESGPEAERKAKALEQIDRFWSEFKTSRLCQLKARGAMKENIVSPWMLEHFPIAEPALEWELGFDENENSQLSISRSVDLSQLRLTETFVERAGVIDGWSVRSGRVPLDVSRMDVCSTFETRFQKKLPPFRFELIETQSNHIAINFFSSKFVVENSENDQIIAFGLGELLLGEQVAERWVGRSQTLFDETATEDNFDFNAMAVSFQTAFANKRNSILNKLPDQPYALWDCQRDLSMLTVATEEELADTSRYRRRFTILTFWPELFLGMAASRSFFSERFLKKGQSFAYLQLIDIIPEFSQEVRDRLEDDIISSLAVAEAGCMVGSGRGNPDSYYFDLCLTSIDRAIDVLREVCQRANLPNTCWLRFYDLHWDQEWVRMFSDTPDFEEPERLG